MTAIHFASATPVARDDRTSPAGPIVSSGWPASTTAFVVAFFVYEVLYVFGAFSTQYFFLLAESHRAISLGLLIVLTCLLKRARRDDTGPVPWYDYVIMAAGAFGCFYIAPTSTIVELQMASPVVEPLQLALGIVTILVLLEGTRRVSGLVLPGLLVVFVLYAMFADRMPGLLYGRAHSFSRVVGELYLSLDGVFGSVMGLWTSILVVFILFGGFLQASGAGQFFIDLALGLTGHLRGGPAKVAIIASGLFGTISGSAAADVATTGVITIPMMKGVGYRPAFAGAVEAVASTGGVLMPPVMGMVAFMIAEFLDVPYLEVCVAAAIPAVLFYTSLYLQVDFEARRTGLEGLPRAGLPSIGGTLRRGWFFVLPLIVLVYYLAVRRYPPGLSALYGLLSLFVVTAFTRQARFDWPRIRLGFEIAARNSLVIAIICGSVGMLIASVVITGAALRAAVLLVEASNGSLFVLLVLAGFASLILGTGVPAIASYTLLAVTVAPALTELGVPPLGAHLFVLYWGVSLVITPPVGGTLYVASSLSGVDIWRQGWHTLTLGLALFVVPFLFTYHSELLMMGTPTAIVWQTLLAVAALTCITAGVIGYVRGPLAWPNRVLLLVAGVACVVQGTVLLTVAGLIVSGTVVAQRSVVRGVPDRHSSEVSP